MSEHSVHLELRPVVAADEPFLRRLYASTRAEEMALVVWSEVEKRAFCDMQFDLQDRHYRAHHPEASFDLVLVDGKPAGRVTVDRSGRRLHVVDIAVLPEFRDRGIASELLGQLLEEARAARVPVVLEVEVQNRALRLYQRLGFMVTNTVGIHHELTWQPEAPAQALSA